MSQARTIRGFSPQEDVFSFSASDNEIVLANIGDQGWDDANEQAVADLIAAWNPNAIFTNGDNSYGGADYAADVDAYYGDWVDRSLFFPCPGNHDYDDGDGVAYHEYFSGIIKGQYYYSKQLGPVTLFMLDGNSVTPDGNTGSSVQAEWLEREATNCRSPWKVAVIHQAPYSSDSSHGNTEDSQWDFAGAGINLVLSGHAHDYERLSVNGLTYIVNGAGGSPLRGFDSSPESGSQFRYNTLHGAGKLIATPKRLVWRFHSYDGALVDSITLEK